MYFQFVGSAVDDFGKMAAAKTEAEKYCFKLPSIRNIAETSTGEVPADAKVPAIP